MEPFSPRFVCGSTTVEKLADMVVDELLQALTKINLLTRSYCAAQGQPLPLLYDAGVRYQRENYAGRHPEDWIDVIELYRRRQGDCEDLACARAAELQDQGESARAFFTAKQRPGGGRLLHILVRRGDGSTEDPSRLLGMQGSP